MDKQLNKGKVFPDALHQKSINYMMQNMNENLNPQEILSPADYHWFSRWLSDEQMQVAITKAQKEGLNYRQTFNLVEVHRIWIEKGYPITGPTWELPSEEEIQKRIEESNQRFKDYKF